MSLLVHAIVWGIIVGIFFYIVEQIKEAYRNLLICLQVQNEHLREIIQKLNR